MDIFLRDYEKVMDQQRRNKINNKCEELIKSNPDCISNYIVDVKAIVRYLGGEIIVLSGNHFVFEAQVSKHGKTFKIVLQKCMMQQRQRFSIAHELGHLFLHMGFNISSVKTTLWEQTPDGCDYCVDIYRSVALEYEANEFACALLMPNKEYKHIMDENTNWVNGTVNIECIAKTFRVSSKTARLRGKWLGLI